MAGCHRWPDTTLLCGWLSGDIRFGAGRQSFAVPPGTWNWKTTCSCALFLVRRYCSWCGLDRDTVPERHNIVKNRPAHNLKPHFPPFLGTNTRRCRRRSHVPMERGRNPSILLARKATGGHASAGEGTPQSGGMSRFFGENTRGKISRHRSCGPKAQPFAQPRATPCGTESILPTCRPNGPIVRLMTAPLGRQYRFDWVNFPRALHQGGQNVAKKSRCPAKAVNS
jgi:hypothetical protein